MTPTNRSGRVLVVDDERAVADLYANWLDADHDVQVAYDGSQALELADDDVDVLFLDRQMPGRSGDEVLEVLDERGLDCRIVMVTAVDPGFDIVEMPFDDYLIKPVTREALTESVEEMLTRDTYDDQMQEYFALVSKKATLDAQKSRAELAESDAYAEITTRVEEFRNRVDETAARVTSFEGLFYELPGGN
ncbi:HalX domain-containing protein [Halobacteria archaeon HArc-gm2]|nr:HalX domain-containing protein [Halobacteria archaeon HArc-gm2]